jgi:excinuclease UvrABC ATPase subunit
VRASGEITVERGDGKTVSKTFIRAGGMCRRCEGLGTVSDIERTQLGSSLTDVTYVFDEPTAGLHPMTSSG